MSIPQKKFDGHFFSTKIVVTFLNKLATPLFLKQTAVKTQICDICDTFSQPKSVLSLHDKSHKTCDIYYKLVLVGMKPQEVYLL